jgi:phenylacetate-coenzyme A ligase PaaK-like adenylate-forming protein
MTPLRHLRTRRYAPEVARLESFYAQPATAASIRAWQLEKFNAQWRLLREHVAYFRRLSAGAQLPVEFSSWQEFKELMPLMDRTVIQKEGQALTCDTSPPDYWCTTGGATAEPLRLPAWNSERKRAAANIWYARKWFGVSPADRVFLIWGHSHLLGTGWRGYLNGAKRRLKDQALGYHRYSAYDLSEESLRRAAEALLSFRPQYLIGYAAALDRFARVNGKLQDAFRALNLKVVVATAESFPRADSKQLISETLGCPVVMEYGAVETGPIAYQKVNGLYSVLWNDYFIEGKPSALGPGYHEIFLTSLFTRCLPLVRYKIGDLISADPNADDFAQEFGEVVGRCNDFLELRNGVVVHSEAFTHAVKEAPHITGYQVSQSATGEVMLDYVSAEPLAEGEMMALRDRFRRINVGLETIGIRRVTTLEQTIAGKTRRISKSQ